MKPKNDKPTILVIDDEPDRLRDEFALRFFNDANTYTEHPNDLEIDDLESANLVLVDYRLDEWPQRDLQAISLRPKNGVALASILREYADEFNTTELKAFALHTAHLRDIQGRFPTGTAQHVLARLNNVEWIFPKTESRRFDQMLHLAEAVRRLPSEWPNDSAKVVRKLLAMDEESNSHERCWHDVKDCRVPIDEMTDGGHGILFIRWLLHDVLPYPCFLWAEHWVAARLRISLDALREVLKGYSVLAQELRSMRYTGILAGFLGKRWWRGALEDYVWNLTGGHKVDGQQFRDVLTKCAGMELDPVDANPAVVCLDNELEPTEGFKSPMDVVTLRPDHWPPFAEPAWIDIDTVRDDPLLISIVDPLDLHRVGIDDE